MATDVEIAWAAGLFEGEGSITYTRVPHLRIAVAMTDRDVIERFRSIAGVGSLSGWQGQAPRKYTWLWYVDGNAAADWLSAMLPHFGERRSAAAREALETRSAFIAEVTATRKCAWCSTYFSPPYSQASARKRFCSKSCRNASNYERRRARKAVA